MLLLPAPSADQADMVRSTLQSLEAAARRGVKVRVLASGSAKLPAAGDGVAVRHIYRESGKRCRRC